MPPLRDLAPGGRPAAVPQPAPAGPSTLPTTLAAGRSSSVVVLRHGVTGDHALVISSAARSDTQVVTLPARSGAPAYDPSPGVGSFATEGDALAALDAAWRAGPPPPPPPQPLGAAGGGDGGGEPAPPPPRPRPAYEVVARGCALLGYALFSDGEGAVTASPAPPSAPPAPPAAPPAPPPPGPAGVLLLATAARPAAVLPGGHVVRTVTDVAWVPVPVLGEDGSGDDGGAAPAAVAARGRAADAADALSRFRVPGSHYYCETADVTRPWVHGAVAGAPTRPAAEFVWNRWLASALTDGLCPPLPRGAGPPPLVQGSADGRGGLADAAGVRFGYALLTRVSRLHAGTRYRARGLNAAAGPGNEVEVEQLVWRGSGGRGGGGGGGGSPPAGPAPVPPPTPLAPGQAAPESPPEPLPAGSTTVSSAVWRRGTVPVWWGVELRGGGVGEASVVVRPPPGTFIGTRRYFRRLQKRYGRWAAAAARDGGGNGGAAPAATTTTTTRPPCHGTPVICINLLRCSQHRRDELILSENLSTGVRLAVGRERENGATATSAAAAAPAAHPPPPLPPPAPPLALSVVNFDWHASCKDFTPAGAVEGLWMKLGALLADVGATVGVLRGGGGGGNGGGGAGARPPAPACLTLTAAQTGLLRFNCADSLDRTNAASYFVATALVVEQARCLGLRVWEAGLGGGGGGRPPAPPPQPPRPPPFPPPLPPGWEARVHPTSGRVFYIDHTSRSTTWVRPGGGEGGGGAAEQPGAPGPAAAAAAAGAAAATAAAPAPSPPPPPPWSVIAAKSVSAARSHLLPALVSAQAAAFGATGDVISHLYTASPAMHADVLSLLLCDADPGPGAGGGGLSGAGSDREGGADAVAAAVADVADAAGAAVRGGAAKLRNVGLSVQRRFFNVARDGGRQAAVDLFLTGGAGPADVPPEWSESEGEDVEGAAPQHPGGAPPPTVAALAAVTAGAPAPPSLVGLALSEGGGSSSGGDPSPPPGEEAGDPLGVGLE